MLATWTEYPIQNITKAAESHVKNTMTPSIDATPGGLQKIGIKSPPENEQNLRKSPASLSLYKETSVSEKSS